MTLDFALHATFVCVGMAVADGFWAYWTTAANDGSISRASIASVGIVIVNGYVTVSYVGDPKLLIAAAVGAYIGTALPLWWRRKKYRESAKS